MRLGTIAPGPAIEIHKLRRRRGPITAPTVALELCCLARRVRFGFQTRWFAPAPRPRVYQKSRASLSGILVHQLYQSFIILLTRIESCASSGRILL